MKFALFYHSLLSDWNHGNAHFLRGVATELIERGHQVIVYEPADGWSYENLLQEPKAKAALNDFTTVYPRLSSQTYREPNLEEMLADVDVAIVHEWTEPRVVSALGDYRARHDHLRLLFHDTHHRAATAPHEISACDLSSYDGVLAYGEVLTKLYRENRWARAAWTWHEAADTRVFYPRSSSEMEGDLVWIGNWGDGERAAELREFLVEPVRELHLRAVVHGVRYPESGLTALREAGIDYRGWLPNFKAPEVFARFLMTVHVPRGPYVQALPGIPTIRPFEALACGIPMISAPWMDAEHLFSPGRDYLVANDGAEMKQQIGRLIASPSLRADLAAHGLSTIRARHTCAHRVEELLTILRNL